MLVDFDALKGSPVCKLVGPHPCKVCAKLRVGWWMPHIPEMFRCRECGKLQAIKRGRA